MLHPLPLFVTLLMPFSIWCTPAPYGENSPNLFPDHIIAATNLADVFTPDQQEDLAEDQDVDSPGRFKRWEEKGLLLTRTALDNARKLIPPEQREDPGKKQDPDSPSRFKRWEERTAQKALDTVKNLAATLLAQANPQQVKKFVLHLFELLPLGDKEKLEGIVHRLVDFLDLVGVKLPVGEITALLLPLGMSNLSAAEITALLAAIGGLPGLAVLGLNPMTTGLVVLIALAFAAGAGISEIWHLVKDSLG